MGQKHGMVAAVAVLLAALPLSGCGLGKIGDCGKLIAAANSQSEAVKTATGKLQASDNPADIEGLAQAMDKAGKAIAAVDIGDAKLKGYAKEYKDMFDHAAKDCRDLRTAAASKNMAAMNKAKSALDGVGPEETRVIGEINGYCGH